MSNKPRVLVVDDEPQIHRFLSPALEAAGYTPLRADTGAEGLALLATRRPDALILDLGLPDLDGKMVLERARAFYDGPLLILSARDRELEKIDALDLGADDYVQKPFSVGELLARLRVALRNKASREGGAPVVLAGGLEVDLIRRVVKRDGQLAKLTPREYDVLAELVKGAGRVLTHQQLLAAVWGPAHLEDVHYLRIVVQHLRQKLEAEPNAPCRIVTEPGVGYRFLAA